MTIGRHHLAALGLLVGFAAGCPVERTPNPEHCFHASGDQTCADRYGADRPYCVGPGTDACPIVDYGCVAELPEPDCYSPCGDATFVADDATCLELADESDSETGMQSDLPPVCGDGVMNGDEACDDGNDIDDDECSNACESPICGDGIIQVSFGETCDDGNTDSGDACAWNCTLPGAEMWNRIYDDQACDDAALALTMSGAINLVLDCDGIERRIVHLDSEGDILWTRTTPLDVYAAPNLALLSDDSITIGGRIGAQGQVRHYDADGNLEWSPNIPLAASHVAAVAANEADEVIAAGLGSGAVILYAYTASGAVAWFQHDLPGLAVVDLATGPSDAIWLLRSGPNQVEKRSGVGTLTWTSEELSSNQLAGLAVAPDESSYVVGYADANGTDNFRVHKLDPTGAPLWLRIHDEPGIEEVARVVAVLPGGGALIAGYKRPEDLSDTDGMLSWYAPDGTNIVNVDYDGPANGDVDRLVDVAVSSDGYAVAVGHHDPGTGTKQLWLLKFAI